jgi:hypothetical protein
MKHVLFKSFVWLTLSSALFSFSKIGGDRYTIHLNGKQLIEHFVHSKEATPSFSLDQTASKDQLSVYYSECGKIGTARKLSVKDNQGMVLASWQFENALQEHTPMSFKAKEILALKQKGNNRVKLFYSSREVSTGQLLATIVLADELKAKK